uniref:Uncharacterized protein n=1 Tax=Mycetohabitans sp. TaxID=2571162 RepID=A0A6B9HFK6_9BURK|nr:hypothetical protein [Mycetohabitans sp.]
MLKHCLQCLGAATVARNFDDVSLMEVTLAKHRLKLKHRLQCLCPADIACDFDNIGLAETALAKPLPNDSLWLFKVRS